MPRPVSAAMPVSLSYTLAGLDTSYAGMTGSIRERMLGEALIVPDDVELPVPNRALKGDRLPLPGAEPQPKRPRATRRRRNRRPTRAPSLRPTSQQTFAARAAPIIARRRRRQRRASPRRARPRSLGAGNHRAADRAPATMAPQDERGSAAEFADGLAIGIAFTREEADPAFLMARLYFGGEPMGETLEAVQPWQQGEAPKVETLIVSVDTEVTTASIAPDPTPADRPAVGASALAAKPSPARARSPAKAAARCRRRERLGLNASTARQAGEVPRRRHLFRSRAASRCAARSRSRR